MFRLALLTSSGRYYCYDGCSESIQPFWISREPVAWPWCNLAVSQRRPYCATVNSHSPVGLISRQLDAVDWACVLCDRRIHKPPTFQRQFYILENPEVAESQIWAVGVLTDLGDVMLCPKKGCTKAVEWIGLLWWWSWSARSVIVNATATQSTSISQRHLTADLGPRESDCSQMHCKVSSDWLSRYIKATRPVLEIFKIAGYFPDRPRTYFYICTILYSCRNNITLKMAAIAAETSCWEHCE